MSLTQIDLGHIEKIIDEKIEARTKNLSTRNEFLEWMDRLMGELKTMREENIILSDMKRQVNNHELAIQRINKKLHLKALMG